jgi:hypothetical protein
MQTLAQKLSPDGNAIGTRMRVTSGSTSADVEIIAVVEDAAIGSIREPHLAVAFRPMMQAAALIPAQRASKIDPIDALRQE